MKSKMKRQKRRSEEVRLESHLMGAESAVQIG